MPAQSQIGKKVFSKRMTALRPNVGPSDGFRFIPKADISVGQYERQNPPGKRLDGNSNWSFQICPCDAIHCLTNRIALSLVENGWIKSCGLLVGQRYRFPLGHWQQYVQWS